MKMQKKKDFDTFDTIFEYFNIFKNTVFCETLSWKKKTFLENFKYKNSKVKITFCVVCYRYCKIWKIE